jgi:hypothetical protein
MSSSTTPSAEAADMKQAEVDLERHINMSRPKGFGDGLSQGVGNIVGGCLGAVGMAVLAPTLGTYSRYTIFFE